MEHQQAPAEQRAPAAGSVEVAGNAATLEAVTEAAGGRAVLGGFHPTLGLTGARAPSTTRPGRRSRGPPSGEPAGGRGARGRHTYAEADLQERVPRGRRLGRYPPGGLPQGPWHDGRGSVGPRLRHAAGLRPVEATGGAGAGSGRGRGGPALRNPARVVDDAPPAPPRGPSPSAAGGPDGGRRRGRRASLFCGSQKRRGRSSSSATSSPRGCPGTSACSQRATWSGRVRTTS